LGISLTKVVEASGEIGVPGIRYAAEMGRSFYRTKVGYIFGKNASYQQTDRILPQIGQKVIVQPQRHGGTKIMMIYSSNAIFDERYVLDLQFSGELTGKARNAFGACWFADRINGLIQEHDVDYRRHSTFQNA